MTFREAMIYLHTTIWLTRMAPTRGKFRQKGHDYVFDN